MKLQECFRILSGKILVGLCTTTLALPRQQFIKLRKFTFLTVTPISLVDISIPLLVGLLFDQFRRFSEVLRKFRNLRWRFQDCRHLAIMT